MRIFLATGDTTMFSMNKWYERFFKIISIVSFFLILIVLAILIDAGQATSYEFSIYDVYPFYFWIFILSAIFCGIVVILGSAITPFKNNYWLFGVWVILLSDAILLFIPVIRGYYIYGSGDVLTHIGLMREILSNFTIGTFNIYPIDHILGVIIHLVCGLSLPDITLIIPPFFSFFFILSMYFLGRTIFHTKFELSIFTALSLLLISGNGQLAFVPNAQAFFLIPLFLYLAFKMFEGIDMNKYHFLLLLLSLLIVLYHPLVTIMIIVILCMMQIVQYLLKKYENRVLIKVNYTYTILFVVAVFSIWSTYLRIATKVVEPIISHLFGDVKTQSELERNVNILSQVNLDPVLLIKLILNLYCKWISFGILAFLCIGLILISIRNHRIKPDFYLGFSVMGYFVLFMLSIAMLVSNGSFGFGRIYSVANFFTLLIIPIGVYLFLYTNPFDTSVSRMKIIKLLGVIIIIFCITYFSIFTLYPSPLIKNANQQVPRSDYSGMNTFFVYRDDSIPTLELGAVANRFFEAIYGPTAPRINIFNNYTLTIPPENFGYQNGTLTRNYSHHSKYLLLNDLGRGFYPNLYPEFKNNWNFLPQDFERLKADTSIQKVYTNRNLEVFLLLH